MYTAPHCGTAYIGSVVHVVASGCGKTGTATVALTENLLDLSVAYLVITVPGQPACLAADATNATVPPDAQAAFYSRLSFTCHDAYSPALPAPLPPPC